MDEKLEKMIQFAITSLDECLEYPETLNKTVWHNAEIRNQKIHNSINKLLEIKAILKL